MEALQDSESARRLRTAVSQVGRASSHEVVGRLGTRAMNHPFGASLYCQYVNLPLMPNGPLYRSSATRTVPTFCWHLAYALGRATARRSDVLVQVLVRGRSVGLDGSADAPATSSATATSVAREDGPHRWAG
jgi:hypothetical protein